MLLKNLRLHFVFKIAQEASMCFINMECCAILIIRNNEGFFYDEEKSFINIYGIGYGTYCFYAIDS